MDSRGTSSDGAMTSSGGMGARLPRFTVTRLLGQGAQGFVQAALDHTTGQDVAIKYLKRGWSSPFYKYILREILNHQQLSICKHPHVVEFYEVFLTPKYLGIVMEYVDGVDLHHYLEREGGRLPENTARFVFQQLIVAVDFCHKMGKVNRDIKLANILVKEGLAPIVKLCDFGFSKDKDDSEPQTQLGTALFTAPEVIMNIPGRTYDAEAADLWSCGIVLYAMLFGGHPFLNPAECQRKDNNFILQLVENSITGNMNLPNRPEERKPLAEDLLRKMLVADPVQRIKVSSILSHPWFLHNLPTGALLLNDVYLSMGRKNAEQNLQDSQGLEPPNFDLFRGQGPPAPSPPRQDSDSIVRTVMAAATTSSMDASGSGVNTTATTFTTPTMSVNVNALDVQRQTSENIVRTVMAAASAVPVVPSSGSSIGSVPMTGVYTGFPVSGGSNTLPQP